ncbi:MAG TPA: 1-acyl-sn-glycerol-3-phosphate acyltransferase [Thermoleophilaceae bacterium]|jgi:1-acyl-sn-glycerol-3-phosphate acyltransferase|nr:1-acyl-sn-glycerol-3-phosphate acyltransferase [Thermoleophilaceae bacterium]
MDDGRDDGRATHSRETKEVRTSAGDKRAQLRETAAAKAQVLRQTAVSKGGELRSTAAAKGGEIGRQAAQRGAEIRRNMRNMDVPWARCAPARMARETILQFGLRPLIGMYARLDVFGRERFGDVPPPVVLVANHSSHLDTPTILRALPLEWRQRTAVAAAADYFYKKRAVANAVALMFNTVPIMRRGGGGVGNGAFDHVDRLIDQRWNLLIFPEGTRSRDGSLGRLRSGAAVIAQAHGIPIVPIRVKGTHDAMPPGRNWPKRVRGFFSRRHRVEVHFGPPIFPQPGEDPSQVMDRVRRYLADGVGEPPYGRMNAAGLEDSADDGSDGRVVVAA